MQKRNNVSYVKDLHHGKAVLQDVAKKATDVNSVDKKNLEWNTDLIETMEFENLISQAAQGLYSGEARHESEDHTITKIFGP